VVKKQQTSGEEAADPDGRRVDRARPPAGGRTVKKQRTDDVVKKQHD
jgi:hypothetical protein